MAPKKFKQQGKINLKLRKDTKVLRATTTSQMLDINQRPHPRNGCGRQTEECESKKWTRNWNDTGKPCPNPAPEQNHVIRMCRCCVCRQWNDQLRHPIDNNIRWRSNNTTLLTFSGQPRHKKSIWAKLGREDRIEFGRRTLYDMCQCTNISNNHHILQSVPRHTAIHQHQQTQTITLKQKISQHRQRKPY